MIQNSQFTFGSSTELKNCAAVKCLELTGDSFNDERELATLDTKLKDHNLILVIEIP
jgi:hypothetical protein